MGTWIEIEKKSEGKNIRGVVPYVGTWIEIKVVDVSSVLFLVVPYVGTWIEILFLTAVLDIP